jgi:hypothetical protein
MKKLFHRLSSSRSFAKLFSLLAFVVFGPLFAQPAVAQFGWEPFPPSFWDGGWDPTLKCTAIDGTTTLVRTPKVGPDTVIQDGTVSCTFTDPANNFVKTATCSLHIQIDNLSESCANNSTSPPTSTLTVTGTCPVATIPQGNGTIDCTGAPFCSYAGSDPTGNKSKGCVWNVGFGALKGQKVVPPTLTQCQNAFGSPPVVFSLSQTLEGSGCALGAQVVSLEETSQDFCHSDTWDPAQAAFCDFPKGTVKNTGTGTVENFLTADTEYSPNTINANCRLGKDQGEITLIVLGNNSDPNTNAIAVQAINQGSITVNSSFTGFPVFQANSCNSPNPDTLQCRVPSCIGGHSIVENTIVPGTNTATLTMNAFMKDGTHIVGDVETKKVVQQ